MFKSGRFCSVKAESFRTVPIVKLLFFPVQPEHMRAVTPRSSGSRLNQKSKVWLKMKILSKIAILVKIEIFAKNRNFVKNQYIG